MLALQDIDGVGGRFEVENRHCVGESVVIDHFVIFIGADHLPDVGTTVRLDLRPARPKTSRLHEDLGACFQHEGVVHRRAPVLPDGVRNVGANVVLSFPCKDRYNPAIGQDRAPRSCLIAGIGRFPRIQGSFIAVLLGFSPRGLQRVVPIHQESPCRRRVGENIKRQHVDLCVPKDVPPVRLSSQAARTDGNMLVGRVGSRDQMIGREAERALRLIVSHDPNFSLFPSTTPCVDMRRPGRSKAVGADRGDVIPRRLRRIRNIT